MNMEDEIQPPYGETASNGFSVHISNTASFGRWLMRVEQDGRVIMDGWVIETRDRDKAIAEAKRQLARMSGDVL